jgi:hypothetical protein
VTIAGIDLDTKAVHCCLLSVDDDTATWYEWPIAAKDALSAARNVRDALPSRGWWKDQGVIMYATESLWSHGRTTLKVLSRVQGAVIACLDPTLELVELSPHEWRLHSAGRDASKETIRKWAEVQAGLGFQSPHSTNYAYLTQDRADSYAIAYACRALCERAAETAA